MVLEASLEDAGFAVAGVFGTNVDALRWLTKNTPEMALLDMMRPAVGPSTSGQAKQPSLTWIYDSPAHG